MLFKCKWCNVFPEYKYLLANPDKWLMRQFGLLRPAMSSAQSGKWRGVYPHRCWPRWGSWRQRHSGRIGQECPRRTWTSSECHASASNSHNGSYVEVIAGLNCVMSQPSKSPFLCCNWRYWPPHISSKAPPWDEFAFVHGKHFHSITVQIICDAHAAGQGPHVQTLAWICTLNMAYAQNP